MFWMIESRNVKTFGWDAFRPMLDGKERVFTTRKAAEHFLYDNDYVGRNSQFRYVKYSRENSK